MIPGGIYLAFVMCACLIGVALTLFENCPRIKTALIVIAIMGGMSCWIWGPWLMYWLFQIWDWNIAHLDALRNHGPE